MKVIADVLECTSGVGKRSGKPYNIALVRIDGRVGKVFSDVALEVEENVELEIAVSPNQELYMAPRVVKLAE